MYSDQSLELTISDRFRSAFGVVLVVHRSAGRQIPLYVGQRPVLDEGEQLFSRSYIEKVQTLSPIVSQGDGFKSFASLLLRMWTRLQPIILIDEPEAFLHPPQARLVGELISESPVQRQIFVATHSNEVLQGLLSAFPDRVSVIRMQRSPDQISFLDSERVFQLWKDPILRYSNILNGLFHQSVVLTEADADCRFYEVIGETSRLSGAGNDIFFTYSGGKDRLPLIIGALRSLKVQVATIVDIDLLADDVPLRSIVEAHGGDWISIKPDWIGVKSSIESTKAFIIGQQFKMELREVLKRIDDDHIVPKAILREISRLVRVASPWKTLKSSGIAAIPSGDPSRDVIKLFGDLQAIGIFVVPNGEMEGFCRSIGGHGPRWVEQVLERNVANDPELKAARDFMAQVKKYLGNGDVISRPRPAVSDKVTAHVSPTERPRHTSLWSRILAALLRAFSSRSAQKKS